MQSPDPRGDFFKARQPEIWAVGKEQACTKTAIVLTGTELVKTGPTGKSKLTCIWSNVYAFRIIYVI